MLEDDSDFSFFWSFLSCFLSTLAAAASTLISGRLELMQCYDRVGTIDAANHGLP